MGSEMCIRDRDYIVGPVNTYGQNIDVMFECKAKELAVQQYLSAESIMTV